MNPIKLIKHTWVSILLLFPMFIAAQISVSKGDKRIHCDGKSMSDIKPCMQNFIDDGSIVGLVTLIDRKGFSIQADAIGEYKLNSIFQIMSMAKPFISVSILMLIEQRKIPSINSKISELPNFQHFPYPNVTIKQLLTHTSGMWYRKLEKPGIWFGIAPHLTNRLDKLPAISTRDKTLSYIVDHYSNSELYPLDTAQNIYHYSNIGFVILGSVIEKITGRQLDEFIRSEILEILGMYDTFYFPDSASNEQRNRIMDLDRRVADPEDYDHYDKLRPGWKYVSPEGGLYSTAHDLRLFMNLFRYKGEVPGHKRLLSVNSINLLMTDQFSAVNFGSNNQIGRTLGFRIIREGGCSDLKAFDPGTIGHDGRFTTEFWYNPHKDEIGIILYQRVTSEKTPFTPRKTFLELISRISY